MSVVMTYGDYIFKPVPVITNYKFSTIRNEVGDIIGRTYEATFSSSLLTIDVCAGGGSMESLMLQKQELIDAVNCDSCKKLTITCDEEVILEIYPRILDVVLTDTPDNWTQTINYSIDLTWDEYNDPPASGEDCYASPYVSSVNESWSIELTDSGYFVINEDLNTSPNSPFSSGEPDISFASGEDIGDTCIEESGVWQFVVTHELTARGKKICYDGGTTDPVQEAMKWISPRLGFDESCLYFYGISGESYDLVNYTSTKNSNNTNGEVSVRESWLVIANPDNLPLSYKNYATEEFSVDVQKQNGDCSVSVTVSGTINGLEKINFVRNELGVATPEIVSTKIQNAGSYWETIKPLLFCRAQRGSNCQLNIEPISSGLTFNDRTGVITYSVSYNNRPSNLIPGSRYESITIDDTNPVDVFAELQIPGRKRGSIIQSLDTVTLPTRTVNVEVIMGNNCQPQTSGEVCDQLISRIASSPKSIISEMLCCIENELVSANDFVKKTQDTESWTPSNCRYSRHISWIYQSCSGPIPITTLCSGE